MASSTPCSSETVATGSSELVAHAAGRSGQEVLVVERKPQARRPHAAAAPPAASSEHTSPGAPDEHARSRRMTVMRVATSVPRRRVVERRMTRASSAFARKWSSRPPCPPTTITCVAPPARAARSASSRSVASFAAGWRSTRRRRRRRPRPPPDRRSRGRRRRGRRRRRAPARARRPSRRRSRSRRRAGRAAERGVDRIAAREHERHARRARLHHPSLRRHYPVQVRGVGGGRRCRWPPSQPGCPELPIGSSRSYRDDPTGAGRIRCARVPPCCAPPDPPSRSARSPFSWPRVVGVGEAIPRRSARPRQPLPRARLRRHPRQPPPVEYASPRRRGSCRRRRPVRSC